jgi:hypothetical protein
MQYTKIFILLVVITIFLGACSVPGSFSSTEVQNWRSNFDVNNVDPANKCEIGEAVVSAYCQTTAGKAPHRQWKDTLIDRGGYAKSVANISLNLYEAKSIGGFDVGFGLFENIAMGLAGDFSFGEVAVKSKQLEKNTIDFSAYCRLSTSAKWGVVGIKPELMLSTVNGDILYNDGAMAYHGTSHLSYLTERISVFGRYSIKELVNIFAGLQQKRCMFMTDDQESFYENVISCYLGVSSQFKMFEPVLYAGIPLYSDYTETKSPLRLGFKMLLHIKSDDR